MCSIAAHVWTAGERHSRVSPNLSKAWPFEADGSKAVGSRSSYVKTSSGDLLPCRGGGMTPLDGQVVPISKPVINYRGTVAYPST